MSSATELERLVVKLVGDTAHYTTSMDDAVSATKTAANAINTATNQATQAMEGATQAAKINNQVLESAKALTASLRTPMERYAESMKNIDALRRRGVITLQTYNRAQRELKSVLDKATGAEHARNAVLSKAAAVVASVKTPLEKYNASLREVTALHKKGHITTETFRRAVAQLKDEFKATDKAHQQHNAQVQRARALTESLLTPQERYRKALADVTRLQRQGLITTQTLARAQAQLRNELRDATGVTRAHTDAMNRGRAIMQQVLTPQERYQQGLRELNQLQRAGAISATTYRRAVQQLGAEFQRTGGRAAVLGGQLQGAAGVLRGVSSGMMSIGRNLSTYVTAPIVGFGALSVKAFADFDNAMKQSTAIMGNLSPETIKAMEDQAISLGKNSIQGPIKLAESYYFLASAGLSAKDSIKALPTVTSFATAGMFDMAQATDLLTDAQSALGMAIKNDSEANAKNMTRVSDVLVKAATLANASVEQFSTSITSKAGSALKVFGKDVEEGAAVLAAYADQGIKAELAGNALDRMMRLLSSASQDNTEAHKQLGFSVFDSTGEMRNMADIIGNLETVMAGMSAEQKVATLTMLGFDARVQQVILPLIGTSQAIADYEAKLRTAGGTTEEVAAKQLTSFTNQMKILWNQIKAVAIGIGQTLAPVIVWLNERVKSAIRVWEGLSQTTRRVLIVIAGIVAAIGPVVLAVGMFVGAFASAVAAVSAFLLVGSEVIMMAVGIVASTLAWAAGIGAVIVAIAGLVYWIVGPESLASAWNTATESLTNFVANAYGFLSNFKTNMGILITWLGQNWANVLADMGLMVVQYALNSVSNIKTAITTMFRLWTAWQGFMVGIFEDVFSFKMLDMIMTGLIKAGEAVRNFASFAWDTIKAAFKGDVDAVSIDDYLKQVNDDFKNGKEDFLGTAQQILRDGMEEMKTPLEGFKSTITEMPKFVYETGADMAEAVGEGVEQGKPAATAAAKDLAAKVEEALAGMSAPTTVTDKVAESVAQLASQYQHTASTMGMTARQAEIYKLAFDGADASQIQHLATLDKHLTKLEEQKKLLDEGEALTKAMRTEEEKFADEKKNLNKLLAAGAITTETYDRALKKAEDQLKGVDNVNKDHEVKVSVSGIDAVEAGSAEALAALMKFRALKPVKVDGAELAKQPPAPKVPALPNIKPPKLGPLPVPLQQPNPINPIVQVPNFLNPAQLPVMPNMGPLQLPNIPQLPVPPLSGSIAADLKVPEVPNLQTDVNTTLAPFQFPTAGVSDLPLSPSLQGPFPQPETQPAPFLPKFGPFPDVPNFAASVQPSMGPFTLPDYSTTMDVRASVQPVDVPKLPSPVITGKVALDAATAAVEPPTVPSVPTPDPINREYLVSTPTIPGMETPAPMVQGYGIEQPEVPEVSGLDAFFQEYNIARPELPYLEPPQTLQQDYAIKQPTLPNLPKPEEMAVPSVVESPTLPEAPVLKELTRVIEVLEPEVPEVSGLDAFFQEYNIARPELPNLEPPPALQQDYKINQPKLPDVPDGSNVEAVVQLPKPDTMEVEASLIVDQAQLVSDVEKAVADIQPIAIQSTEPKMLMQERNLNVEVEGSQSPEANGDQRREAHYTAVESLLANIQSNTDKRNQPVVVLQEAQL